MRRVQCARACVCVAVWCCACVCVCTRVCARLSPPTRPCGLEPAADRPPARTTAHRPTAHARLRRYAGKTGENKVDFQASPPTVTGIPSATIKASVSANSGKFSFSLKINDPDSKQSELKIALTTTNSKFVPVSSIKIGSPAADGTRVFSVTPVLKEKVRRGAGPSCGGVGACMHAHASVGTARRGCCCRAMPAAGRDDSMRARRTSSYRRTRADHACMRVELQLGLVCACKHSVGPRVLLVAHARAHPCTCHGVLIAHACPPSFTLCFQGLQEHGVQDIGVRARQVRSARRPIHVACF